MKKAFLILAILALCIGGVSAKPIDKQKRSKAKPAAAAKQTKEVTVEVSSNKFTPATITIKVGTTVTWVNKDGSHNITADDDSWSSPTLTAGKTFSRKFDKAGTYGYHCSFHGSAGEDMAGKIIVKK